MKKISKDDANYVKEAKKNYCKDCSMFRVPSKCILVIGHIYSFGSCKYWEVKNKLEKGIKHV